jgi:hypothetical protein
VSRVEGHRSRVIGRGSRVIGRGSKVEVEGRKSRSKVKSRGSKVEGQKSRVKSRGSKVEGQKSRVKSRGRGSKVENTKFFIHFESFTTIKRGKTISFAVKTETFRQCMAMPYGCAVWLCRMAMPYGDAVWRCRMAMYCIIESFTCGTKSLMRGLMFESIHLLFYIGV